MHVHVNVIVLDYFQVYTNHITMVIHTYVHSTQVNGNNVSTKSLEWVKHLMYVGENSISMTLMRTCRTPGDVQTHLEEMYQPAILTCHSMAKIMNLEPLEGHC